MTPLDLEIAAQSFFDTFVEAFASFDGAVVAERYLAPYMAFHAVDSVQVFLSTAEIAAYFQQVLDGYRAGGCRACRWTEMTVVPLGRACAVATVTWKLLAEDRREIGAWRESYNLCQVEGRFKVFASTDHAS